MKLNSLLVKELYNNFKVLPHSILIVGQEQHMQFKKLSL